MEQEIFQTFADRLGTFIPLLDECVLLRILGGFYEKSWYHHG